jgi:hypothetical protein
METMKAFQKTTLSEILFPVEVVNNPIKTLDKFSRIVVGKINGNEHHLNYCGNYYNLLKTEDIFPGIEKLFTIFC